MVTLTICRRKIWPWWRNLCNLGKKWPKIGLFHFKTLSILEFSSGCLRSRIDFFLLQYILEILSFDPWNGIAGYKLPSLIQCALHIYKLAKEIRKEWSSVCQIAGVKPRYDDVKYLYCALSHKDSKCFTRVNGGPLYGRSGSHYNSYLKIMWDSVGAPCTERVTDHKISCVCQTIILLFESSTTLQLVYCRRCQFW